MLRDFLSPRRSALIFQLIAVIFVVLSLYSIGQNTADNLESRGIATGFSFFERSAGFDIAFSLFPFEATDTFARAFWIGLSNTILVSFLAVVFASLLGLLVGLMRMSKNPLLRVFGLSYIEIFRNLPLLLQLFFWYFVVLRQLPHPRQSLELGHFALNIRGLYVPFPESHLSIGIFILSIVIGLFLGHVAFKKALGLRLANGCYPRWMPGAYLVPFFVPFSTIVALSLVTDISTPKLEGFNYSGGLQLVPELLALILALSVYTASFIAEILRAGIESVSKGQVEAAKALGLGPFKTFKEIVLPQALKVIIPPLTSQYLNITKNSSLAAAIAFPDLVLIFAGTSLNITGQAIEIMFITLMVYLSLSLSISFLMNTYYRKITKYS